MAPRGGKKKGGTKRDHVAAKRFSISSNGVHRRPSSLPKQYTFTPANNRASPPKSERDPPPNGDPPTGPTFRAFPPPTNLFQSPRSSPSGEDLGGSQSHQPRGSGSSGFRPSRSTLRGTGSTRPVSGQSVAPNQPPLADPEPDMNGFRASPVHPTSISNHSSQAQNCDDESEEEEDEEGDSEEDLEKESSLPGDKLAELQKLLATPGRELYTTVLSPTLEKGTT